AKRRGIAAHPRRGALGALRRNAARVGVADSGQSVARARGRRGPGAKADRAGGREGAAALLSWRHTGIDGRSDSTFARTTSQIGSHGILAAVRPTARNEPRR